MNFRVFLDWLYFLGSPFTLKKQYLVDFGFVCCVDSLNLINFKSYSVHIFSPHPPMTIPKLIKAVHDAWDALEIPDIDKYVDTMSDRVQAVLKAHGGHT